MNISINDLPRPRLTSCPSGHTPTVEAAERAMREVALAALRAHGPLVRAVGASPIVAPDLRGHGRMRDMRIVAL